jgi:hypothetical protein
MSAKEPREPEDERPELDEEAGDEEVDVLGGGGPAATWQGGELGEEEAQRADTDHDEL